MKKNIEKPVFYTPENIGGACFSGKNITASELKEVQQSIEEYKKKHAEKKSKISTEKTLS